MSDTRASVRRQVRVAVPPAEVWALVGDPGRLHEWFPGIDSCTVEGTVRTITTTSGVSIPEQLLTVDDLDRRIQYRIALPMVREHLSTLDVLDPGDGSSLVVYAADADPGVMALVIAGAAGAALLGLPALLEGAR